MKFQSFRLWPRERDIGSTMVAELCSVQTSITVERNPKTGKLLGFNEVNTSIVIIAVSCY